MKWTRCGRPSTGNVSDGCGYNLKRSGTVFLFPVAETAAGTVFQPLETVPEKTNGKILNIGQKLRKAIWSRALFSLFNIGSLLASVVLRWFEDRFFTAQYEIVCFCITVLFAAFTVVFAAMRSSEHRLWTLIHGAVLVPVFAMLTLFYMDLFGSNYSFWRGIGSHIFFLAALLLMGGVIHADAVCLIPARQGSPKSLRPIRRLGYFAAYVPFTLLVGSVLGTILLNYG